MIKKTTVLTRTSTAIPFPNVMEEGQTLFPEEVKTYLVEKYVNTNKIVFGDRTLSPDGLELTIVTSWADNNALAEFTVDPFIINNLVAVRNEYITANGILTNTTEEVI